MRLVVYAFFSLFCFISCNSRADYKTLDGFALGTTYHIVYDNVQLTNASTDVAQIVANAFRDIDFSLSAYNSESIISKVNRNEELSLDTLFINVFWRSKQLFAETSGALDISAAPYFDLWGFGAKKREHVTQEKLDSVAVFVGMDKVNIEEGKLVKQDPRLSLNANAIAKGYTSDVIGSRLYAVGIKDFMVEVGGEIYCRGVNAKGQDWAIAIDRPEEGNYIPGAEMQAVLLLSGKGMATSGNYRNFIEENGQKYAHTIDPASGRPIKNSLLSATVVAPDCMTADGLATAFMVIGLEQAKAYLAAHPELDAYLIYSDEKGNFQSYATPQLKIRDEELRMKR